MRLTVFIFILLKTFLACNSSSAQVSDNCDLQLEKLAKIQCKQDKLDSLNKIIINKIKALDQKLSDDSVNIVNVDSSFRLWKKFRDKQCNCYSLMYVGDEASILYLDCMILITEDYIREFSIQFDGLQ